MLQMCCGCAVPDRRLGVQGELYQQIAGEGPRPLGVGPPRLLAEQRQPPWCIDLVRDRSDKSYGSTQHLYLPPREQETQGKSGGITAHTHRTAVRSCVILCDCARLHVKPTTGRSACMSTMVQDGKNQSAIRCVNSAEAKLGGTLSFDRQQRHVRESTSVLL